MPLPYRYELRHDQQGRIIEKIETVGDRSMKWAYAYDKAGRLREATLNGRLICQCHYDRQGRRSQEYSPATSGSDIRRYSYTLEDRLQSAGNNGYTHDKRGFRSIWSSGGRYTTYEYAPDYRLLKVIQEDNGTEFEFSHDQERRRILRSRNGQPVEGYAWHDFLRLSAFHEGEQGYRFAYNDDERTPYAMEREDGVVLFLFYDQIGSLRVVADQKGYVIKEVLYGPFGGIIEDTEPNLRIPIGFAGGLHDRDLGLVRFGWCDDDP